MEQDTQRIARALASMASLGGATISAAADIGIFASEMRHQGRTFLGGLKDAFVALSTIKNSKKRKQLAKIYGLMTDNTIYDVSARHQVGDNLTRVGPMFKDFFQSKFTFLVDQHFKTKCNVRNVSLLCFTKRIKF